VIDIISELEEFGINVEVYDPWADKKEVTEEYGLDLVDRPNGEYDGIVHCVAHKQFSELDLKSLKSSHAVIFDVKSSLSKDIVDARL
jgi:UDP-N-acetyl-D-galactosamine dehydrogenase